MARIEPTLENTAIMPDQNVYYEDESYLDKLLSMDMEPFKIKRDFALEFVEWYRRVINRATMIINEFERETGTVHSCHEACSNCCYQAVEIYDYEALAILTYLKIKNEKGVLDNAVSIAGLIEEKLSNSPYNKDRYDEDEIISYRMKYRSLQIPCIFLKDKKCSIYPVRPTCCVTYYSYGPFEECAEKQLPQYCISYGSVEDWIVKQIIGFIDYNYRKLPSDFNPFSIDLMSVAFKDILTGNNK